MWVLMSSGIFWCLGLFYCKLSSPCQKIQKLIERKLSDSVLGMLSSVVLMTLFSGIKYIVLYKTRKTRLPWSLWQAVPPVIGNTNLWCKSCSWQYYDCSYPCWNSTADIQQGDRYFQFFSYPGECSIWGLDSLLQLPGRSHTSMKRGAGKLWLAPLCAMYRQGNKAGQAETGGETWDKA